MLSSTKMNEDVDEGKVFKISLRGSFCQTKLSVARQQNRSIRKRGWRDLARKDLGMTKSRYLFRASAWAFVSRLDNAIEAPRLPIISWLWADAHMAGQGSTKKAANCSAVST